MGCNNYSYSDLCGDNIYATCVTVQDPDQTIFPSMSSLTGQTCASLDEVVTDLYELVETSYIDMSLYVKDCLDYSPTADADITPLMVMNKHTEEICLLKTLTSSYADVTIDISNVDYSCLGDTDPCGDPLSITNAEELIQAILDKLCDCCNTP